MMSWKMIMRDAFRHFQCASGVKPHDYKTVGELFSEAIPECATQEQLDKEMCVNCGTARKAKEAAI